jgi:catechol 2,3-dioxygenase
MLSTPVLAPPFNITRSSHLRLSVGDIAAARDFYVEVAGLVVSDEDKDTVYLRGIEEICHHSLVLRRDTATAVCDAIGMRVLTDEDLDKAKHFYDQRQRPAEWIERPYQGRTLLVRDPAGIPVELCATMAKMPRMLLEYQRHKGGRALRLDHYQAIVPDVTTAVAEYLELGFRISKFVTRDSADQFLTAMVYRKSNPQDLVLATGAGPRLHHFAYVVQDLQSMFNACDIAGALGFGRDVERGPGRHGAPNGVFVYFRDPDGHRLEFILPPMQIIDLDEQPSGWDAAESRVLVPWGPPPPSRWANEATSFAGVVLGSDVDLTRWHSSAEAQKNNRAP